jgi:hypothetical protein
MIEKNAKELIAKINFLIEYGQSNWSIHFHSGKVDIVYPDSDTPDYEDYDSLETAVNHVLQDLI